MGTNARREFLFEQWEQAMTNPIAGEAQIQIAGIKRIRQALAAEILQDLLASAVEERTQNPPISQRRNASQPPTGTTTQETKQHGFRLIIERMRERDGVQRLSFSYPLKKLIPHSASPGFDAG
jgi:hypothetical protein